VIRLEQSVAGNVARPFSPWRRRWFLPVATVTLLFLLAALHQRVLSGLGRFLVVSDPLEHADLIYVLAGDFWGSRVLMGANLGSQGWAPKVIMSGGRYQDRYASDLAVDFAVEHGYPRSLFLPIRLEALSTIEEARSMGPIFHRLGAKRIILVTSNFHSRRAAQVFRTFLPEFSFRIEGVPDNAFDVHAWWQTPRERHLLYSEYEKIAGTLLARFNLVGPANLTQVRR
jgi:uncharacterized SAM-binding protein YcdF (DUF218 family)